MYVSERIGEERDEKKEKGSGNGNGNEISKCVSRFAVFSHYVFSPVFPSFCSYDRQAARTKITFYTCNVVQCRKKE